MLVAELVQNNHFLRERLVDAERKHDPAEASIAELRDKLTRAGLALERGRASPAGRAPAGKPVPAKTSARTKPGGGAEVGAHGGGSSRTS